MINGKKKGSAYEVAIRNLFRSLGWASCETARYESKKTDDMKVDLCHTDPFNIQTKAIENSINYERVLGMMPQGINYNVVFHKCRRKEYVIMEQKDFVELLQMMIHEGIIKTE